MLTHTGWGERLRFRPFAYSGLLPWKRETPTPPNLNLAIPLSSKFSKDSRRLNCLIYISPLKIHKYDCTFEQKSIFHYLQITWRVLQGLKPFGTPDCAKSCYQRK